MRNETEMELYERTRIWSLLFGVYEYVNARKLFECMAVDSRTVHSGRWMKTMQL